MCGIAGFYSPQGGNRRDLQAIGEAMHNTIAHRGPDDHDVWQDPQIPLVLAHRRLSIIDLSPEGHQPMTSHTGRYVIVYNGEIYNYLEIQQELEDAGHQFRGRSDTEVMLTAFDHWGINQALQKINGMFAFALWDRREKQLHLVRDRLGKKPLYIGWAGHTLLFASELKAFHQHPDFIPLVNQDTLALYMHYGCIPAPYSIFKEVWTVLPGHVLTVDLDRFEPGQDLSEKMEPYWFAPRVLQDAKNHMIEASENIIIDDFEELLTDCVSQRMMSDVPLGAFLSGGIDSSAVVALMQKISDRPVKTFSIGFHEQGFNEAEYAKKIAKHLGTEHHEMYLSGQDALDVIPKLADMYDEPFADHSQIPTHMVSAFAQSHVTVALSGDGGDEMLGGYNRHSIIPQAYRRVGWIPTPLRRLAGNTIRAIPEKLWNLVNPAHPQYGLRAHKLGTLLGLNDPKDIYDNVVTQWNPGEDLVLGSRRPIIPLTDSRWHVEGLNFSESMMFDDTIYYLPNDILTKVDRASMAVSLEVRAPLLDRRIFEYCWRLPHQMKVRGAKGKYLLRQVLQRHVPENLYERPKQGFTIPLAQWLRGPLKDWAEDLLDEGRLKDEGYFDAVQIRQVWNEHLAGRGSHATRIWCVLMFQTWQDRWMR